MIGNTSARRCVIAAIDGSPLSRPVGMLGIKLAAGLGWDLVLIYVVSSHVLSGSRATYMRASVPEEGPPAYYPVTDKALHEELREVSLIAEEICKMAQEKGVKSKFMILEGDPVSILLREAEKYGGILVIGYRGKRFREAGMGSVAKALIDKSKIPVVIVPPPQE
ncbi:MAG: universal stress protein [Thaumarchaeota archaeon]|nr:universal stress protein [Nitrososphaerota archaeon]